MQTKGGLIGLSTSIFLAVAGSAMAQDVVSVTMAIHQPSLLDESERDTFEATVDAPLSTTTLAVECSAGTTGTLGFGRNDEACAVSGSGVIKNPNNLAQTLPRIAFSGGFTIEADNDGYTDARTILANYLRAGAAGAESRTFDGHVVIMPENPSASARELGDRLLGSLKEAAADNQAVEFDTAIDSVRFEGFQVPHDGQMGGQPCTWSGDMIFAYANSAWQMQLDATCGDETYRLEGNMPLAAAPAGSEHQQEYQLNPIIPGAGGGDPFAAADPFATVDGIVGTLCLTNSGRNVDGVYENVSVDGELSGTGVPAEVTRSFAVIMGVFARTFYGA